MPRSCHGGSFLSGAACILFLLLPVSILLVSVCPFPNKWRRLCRREESGHSAQDSSIITGTIYASSLLSRSTVCTYISAQHDLVSYFVYKIFVLNIGMAVLYIILLVIGRIQVWRMKWNPSSNANQFLKRHLAILPAVSVIVLLHVVTMVVPTIVVLGLVPYYATSRSPWFGGFSM